MNTDQLRKELQVKLKNNDYKNAESILCNIVELSEAPRVEDVLDLANVRDYMGFGDVAESDLTKLISGLVSIDERLILGRGLIRLQAQKYKAAIEDLSHPFKDRNLRLEALNNLAQLYWVRGLKSVFLDTANKVIKDLGQEALNAENRICFLLASRQYNDVISAIQQLPANAPKSLIIFKCQVEALLELGMYEQSFAQSKKLIEAIGIQNLNSEDMQLLAASPQGGLQDYQQFASNWETKITKSQLCYEQRKRTYCADDSETESVKIGYVINSLSDSNQAPLIETLLKYHSDRFNVVLYCGLDASSQNYKSLEDAGLELKDVSLLSDSELADLIYEDKIQILVDLEGHVRGSRIQIFDQVLSTLNLSYLGTELTSGLKTIDHRLASSFSITEGERQFYSEKVAELNGASFCIEPVQAEIEVNDLPALSNGYLTFGVRLGDAHPNALLLGMVSLLMANVPGARFNIATSDPDKLRPAIQSFVSSKGGDASRINVVPYLSRDTSFFGDVDILLDIFSYTNVVDAFDSVYMGVPVLTYISNSPGVRKTAELVKAVGHPEWMATNIKGFAQAALGLANRQTELSDLRSSLRNRLLALDLAKPKQFVLQYEDTLVSLLRSRKMVADKVVGMTSGIKRDKKRQISILYHLARTGGTLISKCLGSMDSGLLLSEIHPRISISDPFKQMQHFFEAYSEEELAELQRYEMTYADKILLIDDWAAERNKKVILRDWSHINFTGRPFEGQADYQLEHTKVLKEHFEVHECFTVRHPLDTYISLSKLPLMSDTLSMRVYMDGAFKFAEQAKKKGFIRYEDFCNDPTPALKQICSDLQVEFDPEYESRYMYYEKVTGDLPNQKKGEKIRPMSKKVYDSSLLEEAHKYDSYWKTLELLGYESTK